MNQLEFNFQETAREEFGTPSRQLARRRDPVTSHEAAAKVDTAYLEKRVLEVIVSFGRAGCISDDVRHAMPCLPYSSVTARYKALSDKGMIEYPGDRLPGASGRSQRVMRAS